MRILVIVGLCIASILTVLDYEIKYDKPIYAKYNDLLPSVQKQVDCLAENIYFEAGHEPEAGKLAVAMVTLNRVHSRRWADSVCEVVRDKNSKVCQFSWWCESKLKSKAIYRRYTWQERKIYNRARDVSLYAYMNYDKLKERDVTKGALFYHADYVNPGWKLNKTTKIGRHIFYKF